MCGSEAVWEHYKRWCESLGHVAPSYDVWLKAHFGPHPTRGYMASPNSQEAVFGNVAGTSRETRGVNRRVVPC